MYRDLDVPWMVRCFGGINNFRLIVIQGSLSGAQYGSGKESDL